MGAAAKDEMPLLCELGWHKPDPLARWNAGYYFTTCGRCRRDLVRTAYGGWRVPKGFRIVWQAKPPESAVAAELIPEEAAHANADQMELPIQEVLRHLEAEEQQAAAAAEVLPPEEAAPLEDTAPVEEEPVEEEPPAEPQQAMEAEPEPESEPEPEPEPDPTPAQDTAADDFMEDDWFMNDEPGYDSWDEAAEYPPETVEPVIVDDEKERVGNRSGRIRYGQEVAAVVAAPAAFLSMLRNRAAEPPKASEEAEAEAEPVQPPETAPAAHRGVAVTLVASFGALMLIAAVASSGWEIRRTEAAIPATAAAQMPAPPQEAPRAQAQNPQPSEAGLSLPKETGFVTASLLNCRSAPAEQAEPVRILPRGETVRILALEPAWASISHRGRQCWASTRYLSAAEPL